MTLSNLFLFAFINIYSFSFHTIYSFFQTIYIFQCDYIFGIFFVGTTSSIIFYTYIWTSRCTLSVITRSMASSATRSFFAGFNCKYLNNGNCPDILILTIIINNQNVTTTNKWVFQSYSYCNLHKIISLIYKESYVENKPFQMKTILWYYIFFLLKLWKSAHAYKITETQEYWKCTESFLCFFTWI